MGIREVSSYSPSQLKSTVCGASMSQKQMRSCADFWDLLLEISSMEGLNITSDKL